MDDFTTILQSILLVTALSTDAFVASFAYGTNQIKIPVFSVLIISLICTGMMVLSLFIGNLVRPFVPPDMGKALCFLILMALGILKLFDSSIKAYIRKKKEINRKIKFSLFHLRFILNVYADPEDADSDASLVLSPGEAASVAIALSLDGLAVGFGAALTEVSWIELALFSLLINILAVVGGSLFGKKIAEKCSADLSWIGGALLILLAVCKLFG